MLVAGMGGYVFCREITGHRNAAWLGGATFMLSPFTSGKLDQGWINLLWVGLLAIFAAKFVRATDERTAGADGSRAWLARRRPGNAPLCPRQRQLRAQRQ